MPTDKIYAVGAEATERLAGALDDAARMEWLEGFLKHGGGALSFGEEIRLYQYHRVRTTSRTLRGAIDNARSLEQCNMQSGVDKQG